MNSVQTGIIKKIIKDSIPELRSAMEEINKIKEDISGIKESLSRIERSLSISCEKYDSDIVQNNITKEEIEDFLLVEKSIAHSIEKPGILKTIFSKIFNRDNIELFLSISSLVVSVSVAILVIMWI